MLHTVPVAPEHSFSVQAFIGPAFYNQWHYHKEIELAYIVEGTGTRFIGDSIENLNEGNLLLIGANMPHMFRSDDKYYENKPELIAEAIIVHFLPATLGASFLNLPENKAIGQLLKKAAHGILVQGNTRTAAIELIMSMRYARNGERIIKLLQVLHLIAESQEMKLLSNKAFQHTFNKSDENRLNRVYHYTLNNFSRPITLQEISDVIYMCPHSFCRYFKSRTKKRYSQFLLEIRVSHACKLLMETDYSMYVVCHESGFNNLSNFNRHFKLITGKTPMEYKKGFQGV